MITRLLFCPGLLAWIWLANCWLSSLFLCSLACSSDIRRSMDAISSCLLERTSRCCTSLAVCCSPNLFRYLKTTTIINLFWILRTGLKYRLNINKKCFFQFIYCHLIQNVDISGPQSNDIMFIKIKIGFFFIHFYYYSWTTTNSTHQ